MYDRNNMCAKNNPLIPGDKTRSITKQIAIGVDFVAIPHPEAIFCPISAKRDEKKGGKTLRKNDRERSGLNPRPRRLKNFE